MFGNEVIYIKETQSQDKKIFFFKDLSLILCLFLNHSLRDDAPGLSKNSVRFFYIHIKLVISTRYTNNWTIRKIIEYDDGIFSYNED